MVDLGVGVEADAGDAVEQLLVLVDGTADVERALDTVERAGLQRDFAERSFGRTLADEVEDAAGRSCAVQDDAGPVMTSARSRKQGSMRGTPNGPPCRRSPSRYCSMTKPRAFNVLETEVGIVAEIDAGRVAQEIADALRVAHIHFVAGDDGNGARRRHDRRIGLGGAGGAAGEEAVGAGVDARRSPYQRGWPALAPQTVGLLSGPLVYIAPAKMCCAVAGPDVARVAPARRRSPAARLTRRGWPVFCASDGDALISSRPARADLPYP